MKVLVIFGLLVVYAQATSEPISVQKRVSQVQNECIEENGWDANEIKSIAKNAVLPIDNPRQCEFEFCYWKKLGVITDGNINVTLLKILLPPLAQTKYPGTSYEDAAKIADGAVAKCIKERPTEVEHLGQDYVVLHNCISQYAKEKLE